MTNYKVFSLIVSSIVATIAIAVHFQVEAIDRATAQQCITHDWPQAAHQLHMDWCEDNGYQTK